MSDELKNLVQTCAVFNRERKPGEPQHKLPAEAVATYVYDLIREVQLIDNEEMSEIGYALGIDDPDLNLHRRACAILHNLKAMRALAASTNYLLPGEGD
jgi:hypothetical protein